MGGEETNRSWPVTKRVGARRFMNIERIFPTMQLAVLQLLDNLSDCPEVTRVIVFGSSIRPDCHVWSDLDVYLEGANRNTTIFTHKTDAPAMDIWYESDRLENPQEPLFDEIYATGVVVYEKGASVNA